MTSRFATLCFFMLALCHAPLLLAIENPLKPFSVEYIVKQDQEIIARTYISLQRIGDNRWRYHSNSVPTGWLATMLGVEVTQESEWTWNDHIVTHRFRYDRGGKEKHVHLIFDWEQMKVTNVINGDPWHMKIPPGTQDKFSINLALMAHLSQGETDISFPVADGGKLKTYDFKVLGKETINTALGQLNTIKLSRNKRGRTGRQATLWLSPELGYLLVKMEKADKDDEIATMSIQAIN